MASNSKIEWTDHTFNPWWGCTKVSPACDHCYAEKWARRMGLDIWDSTKPRRFFKSQHWRNPYLWNKKAKRNHRRERVFCASMADVFEPREDLDPWRELLWKVIEETPDLDWLLLTKRPHLASRMVPWGSYWPANVWLGTTVESQNWADRRIPRLVESPARVRFLSCEPLLGAIDLGKWLSRKMIHWVIAGGESGYQSRPSDPSWFYSLRDQCVDYKTPFHFKQWGDWAPLHVVEDHRPRTVIDDGSYSVAVGRFGKKISGRILSGVTWDGFPSLSMETNLDSTVIRESIATVWPDNSDPPFAFKRP